MRLAPLVLIGLLAGCSSTDPQGPDDAGAGADGSGDVSLKETGAPDVTPIPDAGVDAGPIAPAFCTSETPAVVATGSGFTATTAHYELYAETSNPEATDMARLLEASVAAFESWFARPAPLPSGQRMKVKYYKDLGAWTAGLAADGISAPADAGGYFAPSTKTAYLYAQGNPYYSHVLLVHEATHQFHHLARIQGPALPFWYMEGHAEYLSRHDWDGSCVRLGVTSLLSWEDLPSKAATPDVAAIVSGSSTPSRADAWALFRWLDTGPLKAKFRDYRDALDATGTADFGALVADPITLGPTIAAWLPTAQEPMKPVFTQWIHVGPQAVLVDTPVVFSLALVKTSVTHFEAKLEVPASNKWTAGAIVAYGDSTHYLGVVQGADGVVRMFTANGGAIWADLGPAPLPANKLEAVSVDFAGGKATVTFNGKAFIVTSPQPARAGLAASDTTAKFVDVSWK